MEDIQIPMTRGNMEDIGQEVTGDSQIDSSVVNDRESRLDNLEQQKISTI